MWKATLRSGEIVPEQTMLWSDLRKLDIVHLECEFGGNVREIDIPEGCAPIVFNTGDIGVGEEQITQISQSIGYSDGQAEYFFRLRADGIVVFESGGVSHG